MMHCLWWVAKVEGNEAVRQRPTPGLRRLNQLQCTQGASNTNLLSRSCNIRQQVFHRKFVESTNSYYVRTQTSLWSNYKRSNDLFSGGQRNNIEKWRIHGFTTNASAFAGLDVFMNIPNRRNPIIEKSATSKRLTWPPCPTVQRSLLKSLSSKELIPGTPIQLLILTRSLRPMQPRNNPPGAGVICFQFFFFVAETSRKHIQRTL